MKTTLMLPLAVVAGLTFMPQSRTWACEPCQKMLTLKETARKADVIIVGERTNYSLKEKSHPGGPETADIHVLQVLKGPELGSMIKTDAWYGMCPYGMAIDDQRYVMFLTRAKVLFFKPLNDGCAVKTLPVDNGRVIWNGQRISIADLQKQLNAPPAKK